MKEPIYYFIQAGDGGLENCYSRAIITRKTGFLFVIIIVITAFLYCKFILGLPTQYIIKIYVGIEYC